MRASPPPGLTLFRVAARGLETQRLAIAAATDNIANASTTRTADGTPYAVRRVSVEAPRQTSFASQLEQAREREVGPIPVIVETLAERLEFDPQHPDADANGYVHYPDINVVEEMAAMISANRLYEANLTTVQAAKDMLKRTLEI